MIRTSVTAAVGFAQWQKKLFAMPRQNYFFNQEICFSEKRVGSMYQTQIPIQKGDGHTNAKILGPQQH